MKNRQDGRVAIEQNAMPTGERVYKTKHHDIATDLASQPSLPYDSSIVHKNEAEGLGGGRMCSRTQTHLGGLLPWKRNRRPQYSVAIGRLDKT